MSDSVDLLGDILLEEHLLGGPDDASAQQPVDDIEFGPDGGALASLWDNVNIFIEEIDDLGVDSEMIQYPIVRDDGVEVVTRYDRGQIITLKGWIQADDADSLFPLMDTVKKNLRHVNGNLFIKKRGWDQHRKHVATCIGFKKIFAAHRGWMLDWCPFTIQFFSRDYGKDFSYTSIMETITASPQNTDVDNEGTANADVVTILVFDSATSVTAVAFKNMETGEEVTLTTAIAAGDVVIFDGENKEVYLNGVAQTYTGAFPKLEVGNNLLRVTTTGSSFSISTTIKWKRPFR